MNTRSKLSGSAYLYAGLAVLLWSTVSTAFKLSLRYLTPLGLLFFSSLFATAFLGVYLYSVNPRLAFKGWMPNLKRSLAAGLLNPFVYYLMLFNAYDRLPAQQAQVLNYTWAIVLPLMTLVVMKERLMLLDIIALLLSFAGVAIISTRGELRGLQMEDPVGVAIAISTSLVWASYWILNMLDPRPAELKLLYNFLAGTAFILIWSLGAGIGGGAGWFVPGTSVFKGLAGGLYVGLFEMGLTFLLWYKALEKASSTASVSNLIFVTPFLSLGFITLILKESIAPATVIGLIIIIASNSLQKASHRRITGPKAQ